MLKLKSVLSDPGLWYVNTFALNTNKGDNIQQRLGKMQIE